MKTILHVIDIEADVDAIWRALTTEEGLSGWWSTKVTVDDRVGGIVDWTFEAGFNPDMEITIRQESELLVWKCIDGHDPWHNSTFRFEIVPLGDGRSRLRFRMDYAIELDDDAYGIYNFNWGYYLESLRLLCATGTGKPYSP